MRTNHRLLIVAMLCAGLGSGCPDDEKPDPAPVVDGAVDPGAAADASSADADGGQDAAAACPAPLSVPVGDSGLAPFRGEGIRFAYPADLARAGDACPPTYVFERPVPGDEKLNRFAFTYLGRVRQDQLPAPRDFLIRKTMADRNLTLQGETHKGIFIARAIADTGVPGPNRYVHLLYMQRWDTLSETVSWIEERLRGKIPETRAVMMLEVSAPSLAVVEDPAVEQLLTSIAWSASVVAEEIPAAELPGGVWRGQTAGLSSSLIIGADVLGHRTDHGTVELRLDAVGGYRLVTDSRTACTGSEVCAYGGAQASSEGTYRYDGGVLALVSSRCELRSYDETYRLSEPGPCSVTTLPISLRLEPALNGNVRVNGRGQSPVRPLQESAYLIREEGPPGSWNVAPPPDHLLPGEPPGPVNDAFQPCGEPVDEQEPNGYPTGASPYPHGQTVSGCTASSVDFDSFEVIPPVSTPAGGYFEATVLRPDDSFFSAWVERVDPEGKVTQLDTSSIYAPSRPSAAAGKPFHFGWAASPGYRYQVMLYRESAGDPTRYTFRATYHPVNDLNEPNGTKAQATPMKVGQPVTGYLFNDLHLADHDHFAVDLQPGPATITLEDAPAPLPNSSFLVSLVNPKGFYVGTRDRRLTGPGEIKIQILEAAVHDLEIWALIKFPFFQSPEANQPPEMWAKPYRLRITQP